MILRRREARYWTPCNIIPPCQPICVARSLLARPLAQMADCSHWVVVLLRCGIPQPFNLRGYRLVVRKDQCNFRAERWEVNGVSIYVISPRAKAILPM